MYWTRTTTDDLPVLEEWFQDTETHREMSGMLPLGEWFTRINLSSDYYAWMVRDGETFVGCLILDIVEHTGHLALIVNPAFRGKRYGRRILIELLKLDVAIELPKIVANIRPGHMSSQRCFQAAGFELEATADADGFVRYVIQP